MVFGKNHFACVVFIDDEEQTVFTGRYIFTFQFSCMRKGNSSVLIGAGPPGGGFTIAEILNVPSIRYQFAPDLASFYRWPGIVYSDRRYADLLRYNSSGTRRSRRCDRL